MHVCLGIPGPVSLWIPTRLFLWIPTLMYLDIPMLASRHHYHFVSHTVPNLISFGHIRMRRFEYLCSCYAWHQNFCPLRRRNLLSFGYWTLVSFLKLTPEALWTHTVVSICIQTLVFQHRHFEQISIQVYRIRNGVKIRMHFDNNILSIRITTLFCFKIQALVSLWNMMLVWKWISISLPMHA